MPKLNVKETLTIADPCYLGQHEHLVVNIGDCEGDWTARAEVVDAGVWGNRIARVVLDRSGTNPQSAQGEREWIADLGVDSGQMSYWDSSKDRPDYDTICEDNNPYTEVNEIQDGFLASSTGFGDGVYPLYVERTMDGRPARIVVEFIDPVELD